MDQDAPRSNRHGEQNTDPLGHVHEWEALALDYLDGRLTEQELSLVERHLDTCPQCRAALDTQRWIATWNRSIPPVQAPPDLAAKVFEALKPQTQRRKTPRPTPTTPIWRDRVISLLRPRNLAVVTAIAALVVMGAVTLRAPETTLQQAPIGPVATSSVATTGVPAAEQFQGAPNTTTALQTDVGNVITTDTGAALTTVATLVAESDTITTIDNQISAGGITSTTTLDGNTTATSVSHMLKSAVPGAPEPKWLAFSQGETQTQDVAVDFQELTGLQPLPEDQWMGGPTFAVVASETNVASILDHLRSKGFRVEASARPADLLGNTVNLILAGFTSYSVMYLSDGAIHTQRAQYTKLPPDDHALLVFFAIR